MNSSFSNIVNTVVLIFVFIIIIVLAYFSTRLVGKFQNNIISTKSNIKIIEYFKVGNNKFIAIVKIGEKYYSLGIGKDTINLLSEIDKEEIKENDISNRTISFKEIFDKVKNKKTDDNN